MQFFVRKYAWAMKLIVIAVVAILLAVALNRVVAIFLAPYTVPEISLKKPKKKTVRKASSRLRNLAPSIVKRCLFGCAEEELVAAEMCPDGCADDEACEDGSCVPLQVAENSSLPSRSEMDAKLMGVMVAKNSDYSTVLMKLSDQTFVLGIGEQILDAEIVEIRRERVIIRRNGRLEYIKLENSIIGNPSASLAVRAPTVINSNFSNISSKVNLEKIPKSENVKPGSVNKISKNEYQIDRTVIDKELSDRKKLISQVSVMPNYDKTGTKSHGIKLAGIRSGSIYSRLGIQSNDVLTKINGRKIESQAHALDLLSKLKGKNQASIEVERKGKAKELKYKVKK